MEENFWLVFLAYIVLYIIERQEILLIKQQSAFYINVIHGPAQSQHMLGWVRCSLRILI